MFLAKFKTTVTCFLVLGKGSQISSHIACTVYSKEVASLEKILVFNKKQLRNPRFSARTVTVEHSAVR